MLGFHLISHMAPSFSCPFLYSVPWPPPAPFPPCLILPFQSPQALFTQNYLFFFFFLVSHPLVSYSVPNLCDYMDCGLLISDLRAKFSLEKKNRFLGYGWGSSSLRTELFYLLSGSHSLPLYLLICLLIYICVLLKNKQKFRDIKLPF